MLIFWSKIVTTSEHVAIPLLRAYVGDTKGLRAASANFINSACASFTSRNIMPCMERKFFCFKSIQNGSRFDLRIRLTTYYSTQRSSTLFEFYIDLYTLQFSYIRAVYH